MNGNVSTDTLDERTKNIETNLADFKAETKKSLADILNEIRGSTNKINNLELWRVTIDAWKVTVDAQLQSFKTLIEMLTTKIAATDNIKKGESHVWRNILAAIGFTCMVIGTIIGIISLFLNIHK